MIRSLLSYPNITLAGFDRDQALERAERGENPGPGQYAFAWQHGAQTLMLRDPTGSNKLFFGTNNDGDLVVANRIDQALSAGVSLDALASCPPGHVVRWQDGHTVSTSGFDLSVQCEDELFDLETFKADVADRLDKAFASMGDMVGDRQVVVCLSGGLDSSTILKFAQRHLQNVTAVSFSYLSEDDSDRWRQGAEPNSLASRSDDFKAAEEVAFSLDTQLLPIFRTAKNVEPVIGPASTLCQDWRDFNVHCAVVNLFLAEGIAEHFSERSPVVMTGDLMNELICDYHEETINGTVYYPQPRISLGKRRRFFVRGLDAGDRELGVFNAYGLLLVQPFTFVANSYMTVPSRWLEGPDAKVTLNGHLLGDDLLARVSQVKQRAQVGGPDGGTLGIFHRLGVDQEQLKTIWRDNLPECAGSIDPHDIIQFGTYRAEGRKD